MIVFDASTLVSAALRRGSLPDRGVRHALDHDVVALSAATWDELRGVLLRPKFAQRLPDMRRDEFLAELAGPAHWFMPLVRVTDCRDAKDNRYLELGLAAGADVIVSSDDDLLVLHPWRGIPILRPAGYLAVAGGG